MVSFLKECITHKIKIEKLINRAVIGKINARSVVAKPNHRPQITYFMDFLNKPKFKLPSIRGLGLITVNPNRYQANVVSKLQKQ